MTAQLDLLGGGGEVPPPTGIAAAVLDGTYDSSLCGVPDALGSPVALRCAIPGCTDLPMVLAQLRAPAPAGPHRLCHPHSEVGYHALAELLA